MKTSPENYSVMFSVVDWERRQVLEKWLLDVDTTEVPRLANTEYDAGALETQAD